MQKDAQLARAGMLHREGRLDEAIALYRVLLRETSGAFEVTRLLILALLQSGRVKEAHAAARKARDGHRNNPHAHLLMGATLQAEEKWDRALAAFETAARLDPGLLEAHYLSGNMLLRLDRFAEAVACFDRALALDANAIEVLANRSVALSRLARPEEALRDCDRLVALQPADPRHHLSRGWALLELGRFAEAAAAAEVVLRIAPRLADGFFLKAQGLAGQADLDGARAAFAAAVTAAPDRPHFQAALIRTDRQLGQLEAARSRAEQIAPRMPSAAVWLELAEVRRELKDASGAREAVEHALGAEPHAPAALTTKARLLLDADQPREARALVDRALAVDPLFPMARYLKAGDDLAEGRWEAGWAEYESRSSFLPPPYRPLPFTRWDGQGVPRQLVVVGEQGIGDLIQFGRLLRVLADLGIGVCLLTKPRHVPLLSRIDARVPVISDLSGIDVDAPGLFWVPLASLPGLLAPDPAFWPRPPYLTAQPERIVRWRALAGNAFTVGICWQGDPSPAVDIGRSAPLEQFAPLAALDGVELISLQKGPGEEQLDTCSFAGRIQRLGPDFDAEGTFVDTSALLQHLDLVVTTDTSMAHLAGARDRPTILALKAAPDWRWGRRAERSVLYPSLELMRQEAPGDFAGLFVRIARRVAELTKARGK